MHPKPVSIPETGRSVVILAAKRPGRLRENCSQSGAIANKFRVHEVVRPIFFFLLIAASGWMALAGFLVAPFRGFGVVHGVASNGATTRGVATRKEAYNRRIGNNVQR